MPILRRPELPQTAAVEEIPIGARLLVARFVRVETSDSSDAQDTFRRLALASYVGRRMGEHQMRQGKHDGDIPYLYVLPDEPLPMDSLYANRHPRLVLVGEQYTQGPEKDLIVTSLHLLDTTVAITPEQ